MRKKTNTFFIGGILISILVVILVACATTGPSAYKAYMTMENEFTTLATQYEIWYESANLETKERLKNTVDPLFIEVDRLLDDYNNIVLSGGDSADVILQLKNIKTRILIELARKKQ